MFCTLVLCTKEKFLTFVTPLWISWVWVSSPIYEPTLFPIYLSGQRGTLNPLIEVSPSDPTISVELGESSPPINNKEPPLSSQQKWDDLLSNSWTGVGLKTPVRWFSFRQDWLLSGSQQPPQRRFLQWLCDLRALGRFSRRQEWRVWGLKTSTLTPTVLLGKPAVMITPGTKCIHILVKTIIHCHVILFKSLGAHLGSKLLIDFFSIDKCLLLF